MVAVTEFPEFPDLDKVTSFLKSSRGLGAEEGEKLLGNVGKWIESDIKVSVATKKGYYVEHMAEAGAGWTKWARSLGVRSFQLAKSFIKAKVN